MLLVRWQLLEFPVVIQRRHLDGGLRQRQAMAAAQGAVDHRHIEGQKIAHQRPAADERQQPFHGFMQGQSIGHVTVAQPVHRHAGRRHLPFRTHQQFQPLARHDAPASDARRTNGDDFIATYIQPRRFAIQRHPFIIRRRFEQKSPAGIPQAPFLPCPFPAPPALQHPSGQRRCDHVHCAVPIMLIARPPAGSAAAAASGSAAPRPGHP